jgi:hypothetical protein
MSRPFSKEPSGKNGLCLCKAWLSSRAKSAEDTGNLIVLCSSGPPYPHVGGRLNLLHYNEWNALKNQHSTISMTTGAPRVAVHKFRECQSRKAFQTYLFTSVISQLKKLSLKEPKLVTNQNLLPSRPGFSCTLSPFVCGRKYWVVDVVPLLGVIKNDGTLDSAKKKKKSVCVLGKGWYTRLRHWAVRRMSAFESVLEALFHFFHLLASLLLAPF